MMNNYFKKNNTKDLYNIISHLQPHSVITEQYRKVRTNLDLSSFDKKLKVIQLTSSVPGEGKTVTALNLATIYSQLDLKTLIIDMDFRRPKVHRGFKISNLKGLSECALNKANVEDLIIEMDEFLHVLPAGKKLPYPAEFLMSNFLQNILEKLKSQYDKIIIDTPPISVVTDANIISHLVDGTIMVVASRKVRKDVAQECLKTLKDNNANIIGSILTRIQKRDKRYVSGYYSYYDED